VVFIFVSKIAIYMHLRIDVMLHVDKSDGPDFFFHFLYLVLYLVFNFGIVLKFCSKQYWQELRGWR